MQCSIGVESARVKAEQPEEYEREGSGLERRRKASSAGDTGKKIDDGRACLLGR